MKHCLLLLGIVAVLAVGAPAYSQYVFMDVDGNGICDNSDVLTTSTTSVDVWIDTNHNQAGTLVFCSDGVNPLDMFLYEVILRADGNGSVAYGTWTNAISLWTVLEQFRTSGSSASIAYVAPLGSVLAGGKYKLGSMGVTVTGDPTLSFSVDNSGLGGQGAPVTGFGSHCTGSDLLNTIHLNADFYDNCGTSTSTPVEQSTWGHIKSLYR